MNPYCSDYYKSDALAKTYEIPMVPMPDKEDWSDPKHVVAETVYPPDIPWFHGIINIFSLSLVCPKALFVLILI